MDINQVIQLDTHEHFGYWHKVELQDDECMECEHSSADDPAPEGSRLTFERSLYVPGLYHVVDNLSTGLLDSLASWPHVQSELTKTVAFFHQPHNRQLFQHNLLPACLHYRLAGGPPAWDGGRVWGIVHTCTSWLLELKSVIGDNNLPSHYPQMLCHFCPLCSTYPLGSSFAPRPPWPPWTILINLYRHGSRFTIHYSTTLAPPRKEVSIKYQKRVDVRALATTPPVASSDPLLPLLF